MRRQARQLARHQRRAKGPNQACRMVAAHVEAALCRRTDAGGGLDADQIGGEQVCARGLVFQGLTQRGCQGAGTGMDDAGDVGVVIVQAVNQRPVQQHLVAQWQR